MLEKRTVKTRNFSRWLLLALVGIFALTAGTALAADTDIIITEVMPNPAVMSDTDGEWFEIHNAGATPVDLNGWTISDNDTESHLIASSAVVAAGGYAILARNATAMATQGVTALYEYAGFQLANSADEIILTNASAVEIDRVEYSDPPWPYASGYSMEWNSSTGDNSVSTNWFQATTTFGNGDNHGTPGVGDTGPGLLPPSVANVYHRALMPEPGDPVTIYATITDNDGTISSASVFYQVNGGGYSPIAMGNVGDDYTGTIPAGLLGDVVDYYVSATDNDAQTTTNPSDAPTGFYTYTVANEVITPIATIQADPATYEGTLVKIQAQIYIPGDYRGDVGSVYAYVQDASARGINIFGTTRSTGIDLLNDTSAIVKVSGYVDLYFTTVEIVNYEVELVSTGNVELSPSVQTTGAAAATTNEGTYVQTTAPITAVGGLIGGAYNFTVNDGSGDVVIRVDEDLNPNMGTWIAGDELVAAGAGSNYNGQGQILVGLSSRITNNGQGPDLTPPLLTDAILSSPLNVTLTFNEALDPTTANNAANYLVYQTASPGNTITVSGANLQPDNVTVQLILASSASGISHTVRVNNVEDVAGNPIAPNTTMAITESGGPSGIIITEVMQNPYILADVDGEWFEVYNGGASAVDMNGWTISDQGTDSHLIDNGGPLTINPGEYKVFVRNATSMTGEGVAVFYEYAGLTLGNSGDELILTDGAAVEQASIIWDGGPVWPDPTGYSMQWTGVGDYQDGANWGDVYAPAFGSGDRGTPGSAPDLVSPVPGVALATSLDSNYPNPFNPKTYFSFNLSKTAQVRLAVFDVRGHKVATIVDSVLPAGLYEQQFSWEGLDDRGAPVNSGTYFYRLTTDSGFSESGKMMLLK